MNPSLAKSSAVAFVRAVWNCFEPLAVHGGRKFVKPYICAARQIQKTGHNPDINHQQKRLRSSFFHGVVKPDANQVMCNQHCQTDGRVNTAAVGPSASVAPEMSAGDDFKLPTT
jgi:hypothetical protein